MKLSLLTISLFLITAIGSIFAMPSTANALTRHNPMRYPYRMYHHYSYRQYHRVSTKSYLDREYGMYPNIHYFQRNGHVYFRDLDTGQVYLAH